MTKAGNQSVKAHSTGERNDDDRRPTSEAVGRLALSVS
jgi:hypothetical protein